MNEELDLQKLDSESSTNRTQKNIKKCLIESLKNKYNNNDESITDELLSIHGLDKDRFDILSNMEKFITSKHVNEFSIDDNSNKNEKNMAGLIQESLLPIQKIIGFDVLYQTMKQLYNKKEAKRLMGNMFDFSLAINDSSKLLIPYCFSFDTTKLVLFGRNFGTLQSSPPKRIDSYIASLSETVHQLSNELAGAVAVAGLFMDLAHILIYKEKNNSLDYLKQDINKKRITNELQQFVHSINHLSRNSVESPFSNISIFDRTKLNMLVDEYNWYFPNENNDTSDDNWKKYIIEYIIELQSIFLDFFDKGDPSTNGMNYRFPVVTINIHKDDSGNIIDQEFLSRIVKRNIFRYNIFVSSGNKVASCCRLISDNELMSFGASVNSFGGTSMSLGSHRVVTINFNRIALESNSKDEYFEILHSRIEDAAKILKAHKILIKELNDKGMQPFIKNGWINFNRMFSTFGIIGEVESLSTLEIKGIKISLSEILEFTNTKVSELSKIYEIIGNIEVIPGESMAIRLCEADKLLFKNFNIKANLYSNQFIPLWEDATIWERLSEDGKYNKLITGGGIVHATVGESLTSKQSKKIIEFAVKSGCEHFAINPVYSKCEKKHYTLGRFDVCPKCESKIIDYYTRVVGFFVPVSSFNKVRKNWEFKNRTLLNKEEDL